MLMIEILMIIKDDNKDDINDENNDNYNNDNDNWITL